MNLKKYSLLTLFVVGRLFLFAQTDSAENELIIYNNFYPHTSLWQLSIGANLTGIGSFGRFEKPFHDGFANSQGARVNVNAQFYKSFHKKWSITGGLAFMRNDFDGIKFSKRYVAVYGDSVKAGDFLYESFALYTGVSYSHEISALLITVNFGGGALYTLAANNGEGVSMDFTPKPNGTGFYKGGTMWIGKSITPLLFTGLDLKYFMRGDMYAFGSVNCVVSTLKYKLTEFDSGQRSSQHDFLQGNIPFQNLALSIGVGTIFR